MSVDLPDPDGPMMAVKPPVGKSTETSISACTAASPEPNVRLRSTAETIGGDGVTTSGEGVTTSGEGVMLEPSLSARRSETGHSLDAARSSPHRAGSRVAAALVMPRPLSGS